MEPLVGGLVTLCIGIGGWVWKLGNNQTTHNGRIEVCQAENSNLRSELIGIKSDIRELRDSRVEHSTLIAQVVASQAKIDQLVVNTAGLTANLAGLTASVERVERRLDGRRSDGDHENG
jgi:predicted RNase H-like nuclease (RuvC/YqgF family)